ncbi:TatD family hydrolase [Enterococcus faecium EnGen0134]|nr:TatD family hydrolase [Enterococcus faecium EnGen0008]ELA85139.1 TatD family hydrolase [Enterococcus faecium EnGen0021]EOF57884.1 TatD family hydrolase [Enterococcus faecium EnGen0124]EOF62595.1 TatD family hydrolase [Enterococcus faecium EnGen0133]EOF65656.1 TatD family hydrolase [Enterococcus faecium EnGen0126]EOF67994.1 TatD family hydrolase [Enterococcus faecium EnGen0135]EOF68866.1 TatD family hydrolase [Enterococcus faecium EnGen0130]EOF71060.1 TatD family hydrolase [Enterococcus fa
MDECTDDYTKKVFERQLAFAAVNKKPVVLHTKGCEKEILSYIQAYPNHYLIHWYSSLDYQQDYIDLGCYFSIGLDLKKNPAVWQLAKAVPIDHLLIETDGLHAAEWALGGIFSEKDYVSLLEEQLKTIAEIKELSVEEVKKNTYQNLERFIRLGK